MSEHDITSAIYAAYAHLELIEAINAGLTLHMPPERRESLSRSTAHWMWMTPPRRRGADLGITDAECRLSVVVENKLAGGPAQWCPVSFANPAAVRDDVAARRYASRLAEALADKSQMPHGGRAHDLRSCECTWSDGYHGRVYGGGWACGMPQLDYYCYYRDWVPSWVHDRRPAEVAWVFLSAVPVSLVRKYPGLDSGARWRVTTYAEFLNHLLGHPTLCVTSGKAAEALDRICRLMWDHLPWPQVDHLNGAARARIESLTA